VTREAQPKAISVVLACHSEDRWTSIVSALHSLENQTLQPEQIIVTVDHNPVLTERVKAAFPKMLVVDNEQGIRGASSNRNVGAAASTSEITAFLDDDEVADPDWLELLIEPFASPEVVGTGGRYTPVWSTEEPFWFPDEFAWVVGAHHNGMPTETSQVRNVWAGNMAVRTADFRAVSGFRTDFGKVGERSQPEDTDLCIRMSRESKGIWMYVPRAIIHHEVPVDRSSFRFFVERCFNEGHGKISLKTALSETELTELDDENEYMRRTVPLGAVLQLKSALHSVSRAAAMAVGVGAAGLGAGTAMIEERRRRRNPRS
jgi:GT2 family glycosyltransferase